MNGNDKQRMIRRALERTGSIAGSRYMDKASLPLKLPARLSTTPSIPIGTQFKRRRRTARGKRGCRSRPCTASNCPTVGRKITSTYSSATTAILSGSSIAS